MADIAKRRIRMQVRATPEAGPGSFSAKVSTYNLEYDIGWGWTELILPGAFADSITAHPTIPVYHQHNWLDGPIGAGQPTEDGETLTLTGRLYLGMGDLVQRVYQAMVDGALDEWSIGFWPETIITEDDKRYCDQIAKGDLAEGSICVRGANPDTGTIELNNRPAWIEGDEETREREVMRVRSLLGDGVDLRHSRRRSSSPHRRTAVAKHSTATDSGTWDGAAQQVKLDSPMTLATAKAEYAWYDSAEVDDGEITKSACKFPHHLVSDGTPGAANVAACQSVIAVLNGGMGGANIPDGDVQGVYDHAAKHLRDAGVEPADLKQDGKARRRAYQPQPYMADDDELVSCPECGRGNDSDAGWCDQCGCSFHAYGFRPAPYDADADETVACGQCGLMNDEDASWCDQCGYDLVNGDAGPSMDARRRAAGHNHGHTHADGTSHAHNHSHNPGEYDHDAMDTDVVHAHAHASDQDPNDGEDDEDGDTGEGDDAERAALFARYLDAPFGHDLLRVVRGRA